MNSKKITFRIRTPLMLGGIHKEDGVQRVKQEEKELDYSVITKTTNMNANAFKGLLRWWFRCINGYGTELYTRESKIFDSTGRAARFKIKILSKPEIKKKWYKDDIVARDYGSYLFSDGDKKGKYNGLRYFSHNLYVESKKEENVTQSEYFAPMKNPKSEFEIQVLADSQDILTKVQIILWLALQFAGIGNRSRRCFGNLKIVSEGKIPINGKIFEFKNTYDNVTDYKNTITENFQIIREQFPPLQDDTANQSLIPTLNGAKLLLSSPILPVKTGLTRMEVAFQDAGLGEPDWKEAINFAGVTMQLFRAMKEPDHSNTHNFDSLSSIERAIFGLPLQFRFSNGSQPVLINQFTEEDTDGKNKGQRFASPIVASVTEIGDINNNNLKHFHVQYLVLKFDYNSLNVKAVQNNTKKSVSINNIVDNFIKHLEKPKQKNIAGKLEDVSLSAFKYEKINL